MNKLFYSYIFDSLPPSHLHPCSGFFEERLKDIASSEAGVIGKETDFAGNKMKAAGGHDPHLHRDLDPSWSRSQLEVDS
ncbi:hypothetical protein EYF80_031668 [Liparis tanakae]|uniref:Uncharacterized protein n=1 Tax=Liparis tanakae TaxID=230148 RepID=A0A4Z2GYG5_9TELE|nr:hypothetical protein EYF80_031668 [Liparis tanakae]